MSALVTQRDLDRIRSAPTLEEWASRYALAGYTLDREKDWRLRTACPLCADEHRQKWIDTGNAGTDGMTVIVAGDRGDVVEALCGHCGAETNALWDALEEKVPSATPLGVGTLAPSPESPVDTGVSGVPTVGTRGTLSRCDVSAMLTSEPEPVEWLAEGVVARGALTLLAGREKEGKSLLCMALATRAARGGGTVAGINVASATVLVIDAENGGAELHRRIRSLGLRPEHAEQIEVYEATGHDLRKHLGEVTVLLERHRPDLVIIDSWRSLWGGDENDSGEVARCLDPLRNLLRKYGAGAILIHHMKKGGGYRGSSAIGASVENVIELARHDEDPDRRRRRLRNPACRFEQEADDRWLSIAADREQGLLLVDEVEAFSPTAGAREDAEDALLGALGDERLSWAQWAREAGLGPKDGTARRARDKLRDDGKVEPTSDRRWARVGRDLGAMVA